MSEERSMEAEQFAKEVVIDNLVRAVNNLARTVGSMTDRLEKIEQRVYDVEDRASELEDTVDDIGDSSDSSGSIAPSVSDEPVDFGSAPHAYEVSTTSDGKVLCFLPKDQFGEFFPYAQGGKHMGATPGVVSDQDAGPYPAGGPVSGSNRPTWAHYGWYELGSTLDTESEEVNDKLVIATFTVPRDPKKIGYPPPQVEGPKLISVSLMDADDWPNYAQQTWQEFDDPSSNSVVRQVVIALVANGTVTQLTMTPYLWAPPQGDGGSGSDSDSDSDGDCVPEYELEKTSSSGACTDEYKLKRTDCRGGVTYPGDTIEVPKPPTYHLSGSDASSGCATTVSLSQIPCGGTAIPAGSVDIPKPKSYTISAGGSSGCVDRSYKLMEMDCSGEHSAGVAIEIPKPPEYALTVSGGSCSKTVSLTKTPCGGSASQAGASFSFDVPPTISASATGNSSGGAKAGTVTITPCSGTPTVIDIYNGQDGCTPSISASATGSSSGGSLAGTVYVTPCGGSQTAIPIYNGRDAAGLSGTFVTGIDQNLTISGGYLILGYSTATYTNGNKTTGTGSATIPVSSCT